MRTKLYDYQENTAKDIYNRMSEGELTGAYIGYETGVRENRHVSFCRRTPL